MIEEMTKDIPNVTVASFDGLLVEFMNKIDATIIVRGLRAVTDFVSGLLNQVIQNIFEVPHTYRVSFSFRAWGMTLFFFILMYGFGMFRAAKVIRRQKVIDLLYDNQKNEEIGFHSLLRSVLTGLLSIAVMVAGVILLEKGLHI